MRAVNKFLKSTKPNLEVGFSSFAFGKHACCEEPVVFINFNGRLSLRTMENTCQQTCVWSLQELFLPKDAAVSNHKPVC